MNKSMSGATKAFLSEIIIKLDKVKKFNQAVETFDALRPCCVGAHIGIHFADSFKFSIGAKYFYDQLYSNDRWYPQSIQRTLHFCGASEEAFCCDPWPKHPADVFRKFLKLGRVISNDEYDKWRNQRNTKIK